MSASAHDDPAAAACIGDEALDLGLSGSSDAVCAASGGGATSVTGSSGSGGAGGSGAAGGAGASGGSAAAGTVSAAQAVGLRIVRVRTDLKRVRATKSFRLFVTLKDRRGLLVSGATVTAKRVPGRTATAASPRAVKSNKAGTARVAVRVKRSLFGKRLFVRVAARTPKATAVVQRSVRLPKLR